MKKLSLLVLFSMFFCQSKAQDAKEQQKLKNVMLQAYEAVSQSTRQWFTDASDQHPAGEFDTAFAKRKLKEKFTVSQLASTGDIFMVMMAFQKMVAKEVREDRKVQSYIKKFLLANKEEKQKLDIEKIDEEIKEAGEKADRAMANAISSLVTSSISAVLQIAGASMYGQGKQNTPAKDSTKSKIIITPDNPKKPLSLALYIKKLEGQLAILKKEKKGQ